MRGVRTVAIVGMGALGLMYGNHIAKHCGREAVVYVMDEERLQRSREMTYTVNGETADLRRISPAEASPVDLLIVAVKYTGLESALPVMAPCINEHTIILSAIRTRHDVIQRFPTVSTKHSILQYQGIFFPQAAHLILLLSFSVWQYLQTSIP